MLKKYHWHEVCMKYAPMLEEKALQSEWLDYQDKARAQVDRSPMSPSGPQPYEPKWAAAL
eukprot:359467-Chlamydomonas_euryale.AAC.3